MVSKINSTLNRIKLDGRIDKKDVEELVKVAADGKGITKAEAAALHKVRTTSPLIRFHSGWGDPRFPAPYRTG